MDISYVYSVTTFRIYLLINHRETLVRMKFIEDFNEVTLKMKRWSIVTFYILIAEVSKYLFFLVF